MAGRAVATEPALGVVLAVVVGVAVVAAVPGPASAPAPTVAPTLAVDGDRIALTHRAGEPVDVRRLDVIVHVDGDPLRSQPPVPFFAARGFESGPTGPFNAAADPRWEVGERASVRIASTNRPRVVAGARVTVTLRYDGRRLAVVSTTA